MIEPMILSEVRKAIELSNVTSTERPQKYVYHESDVVKNDYDFIECLCNSTCWCKVHGCTGHYRIRDISFEKFLASYASLWIPQRARNTVVVAVMNGTPFNRRHRNANAVEYLVALKDGWAYTLKRVRQYQKCGLCDNGIDSIENIDFVTNLYAAKIWSQLYYDALVPFDTESRKKMMKSGYTDPIRNFVRTNKELFGQLRNLAIQNQMSLSDIRGLDRPWVLTPNISVNINGQPLSRVLDKVFYAPYRKRNID